MKRSHIHTGTPRGHSDPSFLHNKSCKTRVFASATETVHGVRIARVTGNAGLPKATPFGTAPTKRRLIKMDVGSLMQKLDLSNGCKAEAIRAMKVVAEKPKKGFRVKLDPGVGALNAKSGTSGSDRKKHSTFVCGRARPNRPGNPELEKIAKLNGDEFVNRVLEHDKAGVVRERLASFLDLDE